MDRYKIFVASQFVYIFVNWLQHDAIYTSREIWIEKLKFVQVNKFIGAPL